MSKNTEHQRPDSSQANESTKSVSTKEPVKLPRLLTENLSRNVCVCYDVPKKDIIEAFNRGAKTVDAISNQTYACQGSGCCKLQVERLVEALNAHDLSEPAKTSQAATSSGASETEQACSNPVH